MAQRGHVRVAASQPELFLVALLPEAACCGGSLWGARPLVLLRKVHLTVGEDHGIPDGLSLRDRGGRGCGCGKRVGGLPEEHAVASSFEELSPLLSDAF